MEIFDELLKKQLAHYNAQHEVVFLSTIQEQIIKKLKDINREREVDFSINQSYNLAEKTMSVQVFKKETLLVQFILSLKKKEGLVKYLYYEINVYYSDGVLKNNIIQIPAFGSKSDFSIMDYLNFTEYLKTQKDFAKRFLGLFSTTYKREELLIQDVKINGLRTEDLVFKLDVDYNSFIVLVRLNDLTKEKYIHSHQIEIYKIINSYVSYETSNTPIYSQKFYSIKATDFDNYVKKIDWDEKLDVLGHRLIKTFE